MRKVRVKATIKQSKEEQSRKALIDLIISKLKRNVNVRNMLLENNLEACGSEEDICEMLDYYIRPDDHLKNLPDIPGTYILIGANPAPRFGNENAFVVPVYILSHESISSRGQAERIALSTIMLMLQNETFEDDFGIGVNELCLVNFYDSYSYSGYCVTYDGFCIL